MQILGTVLARKQSKESGRPGQPGKPGKPGKPEKPGKPGKPLKELPTHIISDARYLTPGGGQGLPSIQGPH